jgi:anti-anti-sigma factor
VTGSDTPTELAHVSWHHQDGVPIATISGEVDISNIEQVTAALTDLPPHPHGVVVDLRPTTYLDSSGIALLHDLAVRLRQQSQRLVILCPPDAIPRRILELTAMSSHAPIHDELGAAIRALRTSA